VRPTPPPPGTGLAPTAAQFRWAAAALLALTVYGSLLPFHFTPRPLADAAAAFGRTPLFDPTDLDARGDWLVSTAQYALLGFLTLAAAGVDRPRAASLRAALVAVPAAVGLSVAVEFAQLYFPPRTVSWNDVAVESLGGVVGAAAWLAAGQRLTDWARGLGGVTSLPGLARRLLPAYLAALLVVQLMPFDFVVGRDEVRAKFAEGKVRLIPFAGPWDAAAAGKTALNVAAFLPLGFLGALARRRAGAADPAWPDLGPTLLAPALIELAQLFVYSRTCDTADVITGMAGVWAGWRAARGLRPETLADWAAAPRLGGLGPLLGLAWLAAVVYWNWSPFDFTADPARFTGDPDDLPAVGLRHLSLAPFVDYYWGSKYNALDQFVRKALSFLPVGVLLALLPRDIYRPGAARAAVVTAAAAALVLELGRYFLPSRLPSVTDVLVECSGAWLGFRLTRSIRATLWAERSLYGWLRPPPVKLHFINRAPDALRTTHRPRT
jgi:VanZ family protein